MNLAAGAGAAGAIRRLVHTFPMLVPEIAMDEEAFDRSLS